MIYLILTEEGFDEVCSFAAKAQDKLWLNTGLIDQKTLDVRLSEGWAVKVFSTAIDPHSEQSIVKAMKYIEKKFPGEDIEVEYL